MNTTAVVVTLLFGGWLYDRARKQNKTMLMNIILGVSSFILGMNIWSFIFDPIMELYAGDRYLYATTAAAVGCIWLTYLLAKWSVSKLDTGSKPDSVSKPGDNTPLDSDLYDKKPE